MSKLVVFGAGGRAGGAAVREALDRGHEVTAVVRDPGKYLELARLDRVQVAAGDVREPDSVAALAAGHDAVIAGVYAWDVDPAEFFPTVARSLVKGMGAAGVDRLVWVGLTSLLPGPDGVPLMDSDGYPQEHRAFYLVHQAAIDVCRESDLDWVSVAPAGDFEHENPVRVGAYRVVPGDPADRISYADLAIALVDEATEPRHHRTSLGISA